MGKVEELIRRARAKITEPSHWTQKAMARDGEGRAVILGESSRYVQPTDPDAVAWCHNGAYVAIGAYVEKERGLMPSSRLTKAGGMRIVECYQAAWDRLYPEEPWRSTVGIVALNNSKPKRKAHAAILALMDAPTEYAAEQGW